MARPKKKKPHLTAFPSAWNASGFEPNFINFISVDPTKYFERSTTNYKQTFGQKHSKPRPRCAVELRPHATSNCVSLKWSISETNPGTRKNRTKKQKPSLEMPVLQWLSFLSKNLHAATGSCWTPDRDSPRPHTTASILELLPSILRLYDDDDDAREKTIEWYEYARPRKILYRDSPSEKHTKRKHCVRENFECL